MTCWRTRYGAALIPFLFAGGVACSGVALGFDSATDTSGIDSTPVRNGDLLCATRFGPPQTEGRVFLADSDTGEFIRYLTDDGLSYMPVPSHDGTSVFCFQTDDLVEFRIVQHRLEADTTETLFSGSFPFVMPVASPDGRYLAFSSRTRPGAASEVQILDMVSHEVTQLTHTRDAFELQTLRGPLTHFYSAPGGWLRVGPELSDHELIIATTESIDEDVSTGVHLVTATLDAPGVLTEFLPADGLGSQYPNQNVPSVSYDRARVALWAGIEGNNGEIWMVDADGQNAERLTDSDDGEPACPGTTTPWVTECVCAPHGQPCWVNSDDPRWSPEGDIIIYGRASGPDTKRPRDMHIVDVATHANRLVLEDVQWCTWLPESVP